VLPRQAVSIVAGQIPRLRVILMLRDPIDRIWSHIRMHVARGDAFATDIVANYADYTLWPYVALSNYPQILNNWRSVLPASQMLLINFDELAGHPGEVLKQTCAFLHVSQDARFFPERETRIHAGAEHVMPDALYLAAKRATQPIYDSLARTLPAIAAPWRARHFGSA
jgi:hypothetical protein